MTAHNYTNTTDATIDVVLQAGMVRSRLVSIDAYLWAIVWVSPLYPDCTAVPWRSQGSTHDVVTRILNAEDSSLTASWQRYRTAVWPWTWLTPPSCTCSWCSSV